MTASEPPLTIQQHLLVRGAMHVVDEEALHVASIVHVSANKAHVLDDWRSIGKLALYDAVRRFDPTRTRTFSAFGRYRVRGAILNNVKSEGGRARIEVAMASAVAYRMSEYADDYDILRHSDEELHGRLDLLCASAAAVMFAAGAHQASTETAADTLAGRQEYARTIAVLHELVRALSAEERSLLDMLFGLDFDLNKAADGLGVHKQTAWRRLARLLVSLRRELHARYIREAPSPRDDVAVRSIFSVKPEP